MNCWLRAADCYRSAEFWLAADDRRRVPTFDSCERATHKFLARCVPPGEIVEVPYEEGAGLCAYFLKPPHATGRQPVLIAFGGLDSFKDRSEEHTSELQSLMRISYAVFCLKKKQYTNRTKTTNMQLNTQPH